MDRVFIEARKEGKIKEKVLKQLSKLGCDKIGLVTTLQYLDHLKEVEERLEDLEKEVYKAKGVETKYEAQILGCDITAAKRIQEKVECFLYIGTGVFHPLPVALETGKPVYILNPNKGLSKLDRSEADKYRKKIIINKEKVKKADKIGILVSNKEGQENKDLALKLKDKLDSRGKKTYLLYFNTLKPGSLINFPDIDGWVNTACPRIAIDDLDKFKRPVVNASKLLEDEF